MPNMTKGHGKMIYGLPDYPDLLQAYLPRPITSEAQYDQVVSQINNLNEIYCFRCSQWQTPIDG